MSDQANPNQFCTQCGSTLKPGARFCNQCGASDSPTPPVSVTQTPYAPPPPVYAQPVQYNSPPYGVSQLPPQKSKLPLILVLVIVAVVMITGIVVGIVLLGGQPQPSGTTAKPTAEQTAATTATPTTATQKPGGELVLSDGVSPDDLGNITEGQFFFLQGDYIYYTSFDTTSAAHLYRMKVSDGILESIFDGFAWYLVVKDDWIYFCGNTGTAASGDYFLYRVSLDSGEVEQLNSNYTFGLNIVGDSIYYCAIDPSDDTKSLICRADLDGSHEEILIDDFSNYYAIYNDRLYYNDTATNLCVANLDGSDASVVMADVYNFLIGQGRLIYTDNTSGDIRVSDLDGSNNVLVRVYSGVNIVSLNSYGSKIYLTQLGDTVDPDNNVSNYDLYSLDMNGANETLLFSSQSQGTYINIVDDHILFIDYTLDSASGQMAAVLNACNLDGSDIREMLR